jgi:hypothetical protein
MWIIFSVILLWNVINENRISFFLFTLTISAQSDFRFKKVNKVKIPTNQQPGFHSDKC